MKVKFAAINDQKIASALSSVTEKLVRNTFARGAVRAAEVIADEARGDARKKSGKMAKSIGVVRRNGKAGPGAFIRMKGEHAFLGYFFEFGIAPHDIFPKDGGSLKLHGGKLVEFVRHPGVLARPFFLPALDTKADEAVKVFAAYVREDIAARGYDKADDEGVAEE